MAKLKNVNKNLVNAILYILVGILFIIFKGSVLNWLFTIVGILFIVFGVIDVLNKNLTSGVVSIGIVLILGGWLFVEIVLIVFGVLIAVKGVIALLDAVKAKNVANILVAVVTVAVGVMLIISKWVMLDWFFIASSLMVH